MTAFTNKELAAIKKGAETLRKQTHLAKYTYYEDACFCTTGAVINAFTGYRDNGFTLLTRPDHDLLDKLNEWAKAELGMDMFSWNDRVAKSPAEAADLLERIK